MKLFILLFLATFHFVILFAQTQNQYEVLDSNEVYDMEFLHAKTEELLGYQITYLSNEEINTYIKYSADKLPPLTNEEIERKLKEIPTTLNFRFTPEIGDMIRYYLYKNRTYLVSMLSKGEYYFPLFDREFDKLNVPLELKYISIIESSLNPLAISPMGAGGLWQFTLSTAKYKGIKVNTLEDERKDPQISTEYAAAYLKQLYTIYDDWLLALSAYNAGSGNINKAIKAANGVKNYWVVRPYIPKETQVYVPKIIALSYALYYANEYYLFPRAPETTFDNLIQVKINESMSLLHIADLLGTSEDKLAQINPMLTKKIVPKKEGGFLIYIPSEYYSVYEEKFENLVNDPYLVNEHAEIEQKSVDEFQYVNKEKATFTSSNCKIHCVQSGESLGLLSKQYQCSVNELKKWNNLSSDLLRVGQNIKILTTENEATKTVEDLKINTTYYVLSGDNLGYIANKFNCSVDDLRKWNHLDNDMLKVGQKLLINPTKGIESTSNSQSQAVYYKVVSGDNLGKIAEKYDCTIAELRKWNDLSSDILKIGQSLKIYKEIAVVNSKIPSSSNKNVTYIVKSGDNLGFIAEKMNCTASDIRKWNNLTSDFLKVGQTLKINPTSTNSTSQVNASNSNKIGFGANEINTKACNCYKHEITNGDSLWSIAQKYNTSVEEIKKTNNIPEKWILKLGTFLMIPK